MMNGILKYVLLVEDDADHHISFTKILQQMGYTILLTTNGSAINNYFAAIQAIQYHPTKIEFALIDVHIAGQKSGLEIANYILQNYPTIKIILTTAYFDDNSSKNAAWLCTGLDTIPKPDKTVSEEITIYNIRKLLYPANPNIKFKVDYKWLKAVEVILLTTPQTQLYPSCTEENTELISFDKSEIICLFAGKGAIYNVPKDKTLLILKNGKGYLLNKGLKPMLEELDERFISLNSNAAVNIHCINRKKFCQMRNYIVVGKYSIEISKSFSSKFWTHLKKFDIIE